MADAEIQSPTIILKNSKILVNVDEALSDIIIVTYSVGSKIFQGALLDTTKRTLPNGIVSPLGATASQPADSTDDDKLFSVSQRFTYFQDKPVKSCDLQPHQFLMKRQIRPPARYRTANVRATPVRLRPRQVLCSKCRGICNENSENVDLSQKRKCPDSSNSPANNKTERLVTSTNDLVSNKSPRPLFSEHQRDNQPKNVSPPKDVKMSPTLIPKLSRLQPTEISNALVGNANKLNIVGNYWVSPNRIPEEPEMTVEENEENDEKLYCLPVHKVIVNDNFDDSSTSMVDPLGEDETSPSERMVLRKKKSIGSMEDLWDESVFEECAKTVTIARATPVIKISFGSQGEGTVLKIPSKVQHCSENEDLSARAAKKALKRAKREARRKLLGGGASPRCLGGMSPAGGGASPGHDELERRRRKRNKVKHKKKHKEERKHKESEDSNGNKYYEEPSYSDMKELCLKQKLSISLKRVNTSAYKACDEAGSKSPTSSEVSDEQFETVPDFPAPISLDIRETVDSCITNDGRVMFVGNVVWGKIHGFPWWPGKISCITASRTEDGQTTDNEAHVRWYGSSTMSVMSCEQLSPFLETFKVRYNKKKRGPYKEAIRQATYEAQKEEEMREDLLRDEARQLATSTSSSDSPSMVIDVVS